MDNAETFYIKMNETKTRFRLVEPILMIESSLLDGTPKTGQHSFERLMASSREKGYQIKKQKVLYMGIEAGSIDRLTKWL